VPRTTSTELGSGQAGAAATATARRAPPVYSARRHPCTARTAADRATRAPHSGYRQINSVVGRGRIAARAAAVGLREHVAQNFLLAVLAPGIAIEAFAALRGGGDAADCAIRPFTGVKRQA
jgi:hypothetical protein